MTNNAFDSLTPQQQEAVRWGASLQLTKALARGDTAAIADSAAYFDMTKNKIANYDQMVSYLFSQYHNHEKRFSMETANVKGIDLLSLLRTSGSQERSR